MKLKTPVINVLPGLKGSIQKSGIGTSPSSLTNRRIKGGCRLMDFMTDRGLLTFALVRAQKPHHIQYIYIPNYLNKQKTYVDLYGHHNHQHR
jgi:hypothetical protein